MKLPLFCLALLYATLGLSSLAGQSATVISTADGGAGSLRAALAAANASSSAAFTIDVAAGATAGPIVLATVLPSITRNGVTIQALAGAGRLVVDARNATTVGGHALEIIGTDARILAACRFLVQQGNGIVVRGARTQIADVEVTGNVFGIGLAATAGADDLLVSRFVADRFQIGLSLQSCHRARIAETGSAVVELRNGGAPGIQITGGGNHRIGAFLCDQNALGVQALNSTDLWLGRPGGPRSSVTSSRQQGILLTQCDGASLTNMDALANGAVLGGHGIQILGGIGIRVTDVQSHANAYGGVMIGGGATGVRVAAVSTRGFGGAQDIGIQIGATTGATIVGCSTGPDHMVGVQLVPEGNAFPTNVTIAGCLVTGNRMAGIRVTRATDALICSSAITANSTVGIEAVAASTAVAPVRLAIANCVMSGNAGHGLLAHNVDGLRVAPGNRADDNVEGGMRLYSCDGVLVGDSTSVARNRATGIWLEDCQGASVVRASLADNRGRGIYGLRCSSLSAGPGLLIADTLGSGVHMEGCDDSRLFSSRIMASTAYGVHFSPAPGSPLGTAANLIRSCLIADHPGLALYHAGGPPVVCELTSIAGNLRGVTAGGQLITIDSCIVRDNVLEDLQQNATAMTVRNTFHKVPGPAAGSTNTSADPQFVSAVTGDWRLQPSSPAVGYANPALTVVADALDAYAGPRTVGARDAGAYEVGPHPSSGIGRLLLSSPTMPNGGGGIGFQVQFPPIVAGSWCLLLLEVGPPSGSFPLLGGTVPLGLTPAVLLAANDTDSLGTVTTVAGDGIVSGALLWGGRIPPAYQNQAISLCAVAIDATPMVRAVSNVATFAIL